MPNDLVPKPAPPSLADTLTLGEVLAKSGMFADARSAAQAVVKVLAGRELGFSPIASMTGVHVIEGKPSIGAHLMASLVKRSGRYDYKVVRCDKTACKLTFLERIAGDTWQPLGDVELTMQDAIATGLATARDGKSLKANWQRSPDDMLFARCISKGFRRYCPDLTGGVTVYDPDELLTPAPVETPPAGDVIDASYTITQPDGTVQTVTGDCTPEQIAEQAAARAIPDPVPEGNGQAPVQTPAPATNPDRHLTEQERQEIGDLLRESGADVPRFLLHYRVKTVAQFRLSQYTDAREKLRAKLAQKQGAS